MGQHPDPQRTPASYADAGVDIAAGERAVELMRPAVEATFTSAVASRLGAFGAAVRLPAAATLVSSTDSVGSKICLAQTDLHAAGLGRDLVHHCINDILTSGARPLFFLDYLGVSRLRPEQAAAIVGGMARACAAHGCALVGGETAELPDLYREGTFDIAGFIVGTVADGALLDGSSIRPGHLLLGLPSAGLHTNGFSLARHLLATRLEELLPGGAGTIREALLAEHRCYLPELAPLLDHGLLDGMAHITGGGLPGNVPRMLPEGLAARIEPGSWPIPPIFALLASYSLSPEELYRTFNMGVGMALACTPEAAGTILTAVPSARRIGEVVLQGAGDARVLGL